ncbi:MAG: rRNA maturation RNase YbeY [Tractidigestivibacter sp.]|jgi:probable rRNA maturation factor|uniref:rRNA maturation RNase YbeY n=1 Tax=Tractidigestivibacter sp. TaxID=2847320 RepID=UPI003D8E9A4C
MANEYDLSCEEGVVSPVSEDEICSDLDRVLAEEGVERPCLVSVSLVSDERIHELNLEWRGVDRPTDVVSLECERPDDPDLAPGEPCELGDIVLAPAYISRQAEGFGTTAADEFRLLLVHGCLHLLGYDHLEDAEAQVMEAREDELLALMPHDGAPRTHTLTRHRQGVDDQ